jgi:threonine/homoserine/homoserine lactone efflux protein
MTHTDALVIVFLLAFDAGLLLCYTGSIARRFFRRRDKPQRLTTGVVGSVLGFSAKALCESRTQWNEWIEKELTPPST